MKIIFSLVFCLLLTAVAHAQQKWPLQVSFTGNATLLPPGIITRIFSDPLHPGLTVGTEYQYGKRGRHELFQTAKLGYFFHRYNQHAIQLYTELGYRVYATSRIDAGLLLGGGYHHAIRDQQFLKRNNDGTYTQIRNWGQPHALVSTALEGGYTTKVRRLSNVRFFLGYQFWVQTPFVKDIVPLLPHTTLRVGASMPLRK